MKEALKYFKDRQDFLAEGSVKRHESEAIRALEMQASTDKKYYCLFETKNEIQNQCDLDTLEEVSEFCKKLSGYDLTIKDCDSLIKSGKMRVMSKNGELVDGEWRIMIQVIPNSPQSTENTNDIIYKCIKPLPAPECDPEGNPIPDGYYEIPSGTIWTASETSITGKKYHLESKDGEHGWLEVSEDILNEFFISL